MVLPLVIAAAALQGYGQAKKTEFLLDREDKAIAQEQAFEAGEKERDRQAEFRKAQLEFQEKDLTRLLEKHDDLEKNSLPGTFASTEDLATLTGNARNLNFWGVRKITGQSINDKTSQATSFWTTKTPFEGSQNAYVADLMNIQSQDPAVLAAKNRALDGFWSAYADTLGGIIREEEYPQSSPIMLSTEGTAKAQKDQKIPSITPLISGPIKKAYDQLETVEAKKDFENRLNNALTSAYKIEVEGTKYEIDLETLPNPLSDEPDPEIKLSAVAPKVQTDFNQNYTFDVDELDKVLSHAAKNPRTDPTVTAYINEKGEFINADGKIVDGSKYKTVVNQTRENVQVISNLVNNGKVLHDGESPYISGDSSDQLKYDTAISQIVKTFGIAEATNILSLAIPENFGDRSATADLIRGETRAEFDKRTSLPRVGLSAKPQSYYQEAFENLDRAQVGILDALGLLKDGKPVVGFAGKLYTGVYSAFSSGGQVDQLFNLIDLFSGTDDNENYGVYTDDEQEASDGRIKESKDAFNAYREKITNASSNEEKRKYMQQMYQDTIILRYLQVEVVYNIARTLENPDGSGARLSRTDIEQMIEGTQLGNLLATKDGMIAMLTYLQTRNNNKYQIAKYLKNPSNYKSEKKRAALQMIEASTKIEERFINGGRHLSGQRDKDGRPLAIDEFSSVLINATLRGYEEFNSQDSTLQLDPLNTKDTDIFEKDISEKVLDFLGIDYSTVDATQEALKDGGDQ